MTAPAEDGLLVVETRELRHGLAAVLYRRPGVTPSRKRHEPPPQPQPTKKRRTR